MALKKTATAPAKKAVARDIPAPAKRAKAAAAAPTPASAPTVTLKHLAAAFAEAHEMPKKQAETEFEAMIGMVVSHLKAGDRVRINGLGILEIKDRPARTGRNPATGEIIQIAASRKIAFRPAKDLKAAI
jgi:DNA-binding protein HU-beta